MLHLHKSLLFPTLVYLEDIKFKNLPSNLKTSVYKLDWAKIEEIKLNQWLKQRPDKLSITSFCGTIPDSIKTWIDNMQFVLSEEYLQEIRHCSMKSVEEWDRKRPPAKHGLDPAIAPAISYIDTAFHLLADCLYDPETKFYSRSGIKMIAPYTLLYRFWAHQTEYWNITQWTNLPTFFQLLGCNKDQETLLFGTAVYEDLQKHLKLLEKNHFFHKGAVRAENTVLDDFLLNKVASVTLKDLTIKIQDLGEIQLIYPIRLHKAQGKITLKAEFQCQNMQKVLQELPNYTKPFSFFIMSEKHLINAHDATIKGLTSNPPPQITIEIKSLENKRQPIKIVPYEFNECCKIDLKRIEEVKKNEILALENPQENI
jgi:hypothetical protein